MPPSPTLSSLPDRAMAAPRACRAEWAGEAVELLPERALWWPARGLLFVADLHIGKAATYRALGQPVPGGTTQENLARLDALIARHAPAGIVFLGDFLHAAQARTPQVLLYQSEKFQFRKRCRCILHALREAEHACACQLRHVL